MKTIEYDGKITLNFSDKDIQKLTKGAIVLSQDEKLLLIESLGYTINVYNAELEK